MAVARYAWHGRERLGLLRVRGDVITLHALLWPDEIRDPAAMVPPPVQLDEDEVDEAVALIEAMTRDDLTGPEFADRYTEALHAVIEAKQEDRQQPQAPEPTARPGQLVDLMAALQQSVDKAQAARGETGDAVPRRRRQHRRGRPQRGRRRGRRPHGRRPRGTAVEVSQRADLPWPGPWSGWSGAVAGPAEASRVGEGRTSPARRHRTARAPSGGRRRC
ncbi:hypothetical protein [Streptomyces sp. 6-11-2]|uniref:hypothetical protein n=1 Tax=Streptomyces sp. 6-11-2 TaxID=2585753 RepID=UPI0035A6D26A